MTTLNQIGHELLAVCAQYLGKPSCVYFLRLINKAIHDGATKEIWSLLLRRLMEANRSIYLEELSLSNFTFSENVLLSGSAMVQCALGCKWWNSDTDIFCTFDKVDDVHHMLDSSGYVCESVSYNEYPGDDLSGDESEEQNVPAVVFRTDIVSAVYKFVNKSIRRRNHSVDVVVGKPDISQASQLLDKFDLDICKGSWNGCLYHCQDPVGTFHRETQLAPWIDSLLQGFIRGWGEGGDTPDEHESLMSFLDSDCWKFAAECGLSSVRMHYEE